MKKQPPEINLQKFLMFFVLSLFCQIQPTKIAELISSESAFWFYQDFPNIYAQIFCIGKRLSGFDS